MKKARTHSHTQSRNKLTQVIRAKLYTEQRLCDGKEFSRYRKDTFCNKYKDTCHSRGLRKRKWPLSKTMCDDKTENNEGAVRGKCAGIARIRKGVCGERERERENEVGGTSKGKGEQQVRVPVTRPRAAPENRRLCTRWPEEYVVWHRRGIYVITIHSA